MSATEEQLFHSRSYTDQTRRISIVGIGGAGNRLLGHVIGIGGVGPERCVAVNTDKGQLARSLAGNKVLLGEDLVNGRGALGSVSMGRKAIQLSAHRVTSFVESSDITIILVGFGGGTGTAAAPLVAQWARTQVKPVVAVVALPFSHERERRFVALRGLRKMADACDCTIVIDNAISTGNEVGAEQRESDATAVATVQSITDALSSLEPAVTKNIMRVMMLGPLSTVFTNQLRLGQSISSGLVEALGSPSSGLPLSGAQGAVLLSKGPQAIGTAQAAQAYETLTSLMGRRVSFAYGNVIVPGESSLCLLLTGYDYGSSIGAFTELITELYDIEFGQPPGRLNSPLPLDIYQLEKGAN